jgi:hypothetical protein
MDLKYIGCEGEQWVHMAHERAKWRDIMNIVKKFRVTGELESFLAQWVTSKQEILVPLHDKIICNFSVVGKHGSTPLCAHQ